MARHACSFLVGIVLLAGASRAIADPSRSQPESIREAADDGVHGGLAGAGIDAPVYTVKLRGQTPGATWEIYRPGGPTVARCVPLGCTLELKPGSYRLRDVGAPQERFVEIDVESNVALTVRAPNRFARKAGLAIGISGIPVAFVGTMMMLSVVLTPIFCFPSDEDSASCETPNPPLALAAAATTAAGVGMTYGGWSVFGRNRRPTIENREPLAPKPTAAARSPTVEVGLQRVGTGYGIGASAKF
jgi:hypothetical protein